ncbi:MAG: hypothetical protein O7D94_02660 [Planctomycetota bacterium]|nr:hypothetical protein [Planctomycetota bacterium]MCZ6697815.1 hypothetical protein [Planctomycetota bacterium]
MAGHAPRLSHHESGTGGWIDGLSDVRISFYMLIAAALAAGIVYAVDQRFFG